MRPLEITIDESILQANYRALCAWEPGTEPVPVIKSNGYGHGLIPTARAMLAAGARRLAVFRVEEAATLRAAGVTCPVWLLLGTETGEEEEALRLGGVTCAVHCLAPPIHLIQAGHEFQVFPNAQVFPE